MSNPLNPLTAATAPTDPTDSPAPVETPAPVVPAPAPAPAEAAISLTKSELSAMLRDAVLAGQAQGTAAAAQAAQATPAEVPDVWSLRTLMLMLILKNPGWHSEREIRSALATVDNYFPAAEGE